MKTRIVPGVVVSTTFAPGFDQVQTVTFVSDPTTRSGSNVATVSYAPVGEARAAHEARVLAERMIHDAAADAVARLLGARPGGAR